MCIYIYIYIYYTEVRAGRGLPHVLACREAKLCVWCVFVISLLLVLFLKAELSCVFCCGFPVS